MDSIKRCKFQVGDKVWSSTYGDGEVEKITDYIEVIFKNRIRATYDFTGRWSNDELVTLFHAGSYIVEAPEPDRGYHPKAGDIVAVSYDNETWAVKIFSHICPNTGKYFASSCSGKGTLYRYDFCESAHKHFNIPEKDA